MNKAHEQCGSDEWRQAIREFILPWALGETDLGDDVLEVGPGYGATTDVLSQSAARLTSIEIDDDLAAMLTERFADMPSVQIVDGDATALAMTTTVSPARPVSRCCITFRRLSCRTGCSPRSPVCCAPVRHWWPATAWPARNWQAHHEDDTYNPVDPSTLPSRLAAAGFADVRGQDQ